MKKCTKCNKLKPLDLFPQSNQTKISCKSCKSEYDKKHYLKNKERRLKQQKQYHKENKDKIREYIQENKERIQKQQKQWYKKNKDKWLEYCKQYREENKDKINKVSKIYRERNPHCVRWRSILHRTLKNLNQDKTSPTEEILGYSAIELKQHLDNLGMNWETHHIDHIIPLSWFKKNTPIHLVNDLRNLQVLTLEENISKNNYYAGKVSLDYYNEIITFIINKYKNKINK